MLVSPTQLPGRAFIVAKAFCASVWENAEAVARVSRAIRMRVELRVFVVIGVFLSLDGNFRHEFISVCGIRLPFPGRPQLPQTTSGCSGLRPRRHGIARSRSQRREAV